MTEKPDIWLPLNVGDYLKDTMHLSRADHGAYLLLIMHYWMRQGPIPDDPEYIRSVTKCDVRTYTKMIRSIAPFFDIRDGYWHHRRVDRDIAEAAERKEKQRARTAAATKARQKKAAQKDNVTKDVTVNGTESSSPSPSPSKESPSLRSGVSKRGPPVAKANGVAPWEIQQAVDLWNGLADDIGLPRCAKLTKDRRTKLRNRIRDAGGLPGWQKALEKIRGDPFFRGDNKRGWRCGIDFLLRESSFTKLMEGYYDFGRQEYVFDAGELARRAGIAGDDSDLFSAPADVRPGIEPKGNGSEEH